MQSLLDSSKATKHHIPAPLATKPSTTNSDAFPALSLRLLSSG